MEGSIGEVSARRVCRYPQVGAGPRCSPSARSEILKKKGKKTALATNVFGFSGFSICDVGLGLGVDPLRLAVGDLFHAFTYTSIFSTRSGRADGLFSAHARGAPTVYF